MTHEVYGHVVACDIFGDAFVIPLSVTFQHMKAQLAAESVCLPTGADIHNWLQEHAEMKAITSPPASSQRLDLQTTTISTKSMSLWNREEEPSKKETLTLKKGLLPSLNHAFCPLFILALFSAS
jgi:hypothetical protein